MSNTEENLKFAFAGESMANRKYIAFAKKAEEEGYKQIAKLFMAAAVAETVHAMNHLNVMGGIKSTKENLADAIAGETQEFTNMYPGMIETAGQEGNEQAKAGFSKANAVEKIHAELYKEALAAVEANKDMEGKDIHVCQVCGNTFVGDMPKICPICGAKKDRFDKID